MEVVYIPGTPFGDFFYDPESREGVSIPEGGGDPAMLGMSIDFNPYAQPGARAYDVDPGVFMRMMEACNRRDREKVMSLALKHFPVG